MSRYSGLLYGHRCKSGASTDQLIAESRFEGFGPVVRARILAGNYFLLQKYGSLYFCRMSIKRVRFATVSFIFRNYSKYFEKAMKVRRLIAEDFDSLWSQNIHVLLTPVTLTTAPLLSDFIKLGNRAQCATQDYCTQPVNMAGKKLLC